MTPTTKATEIMTALRAKISDRKFAPRVWVAPNGSARVYTGSRSEYIEVGTDGKITTSQPRMTWGPQIREVI